MSYHRWGDLDANGNDICYQVGDAAAYIGDWLRKWARISVMQTKEKFGTVRIYCHLGWHDFHEVFYPGHAWTRWGKTLNRIDSFLSYNLRVMWVVNLVIYPLHRFLYHWRYKQAVKKWPNLRDEILAGADYQELVDGIAGYRTRDHWMEVKGEEE